MNRGFRFGIELFALVALIPISSGAQTGLISAVPSGTIRFPADPVTAPAITSDGPLVPRCLCDDALIVSADSRYNGLRAYSDSKCSNQVYDFPYTGDEDCFGNLQQPVKPVYYRWDNVCTLSADVGQLGRCGVRWLPFAAPAEGPTTSIPTATDANSGIPAVPPGTIRFPIGK